MKKMLTRKTLTLTKLTKRMMGTGVIGGLVASMMLVSVPAQANNPAPRIKADAPNRYTVKKGDTLWDISGKYLKSPARWKEIWATNKQIKNPHLIYPDDILVLCVIKGKTLVGVDTGEGCAGVEKQMTGEQSVSPKPVRVRSAASSIPAIPLQSIRYWLDKVVIVNPEDYETTPYVLASKNKNLLTGEGDKIYVKGVPLIVGQSYGVYRQGEPYVDPTTKAVVGLEATQVASGIVTDTAPNGVSSIQLTKSYETEVQEGDRVFVELTNSLPPAFYPRPAQVSRAGQVVRVMGSIGKAGPNSVVAINLGKNNGAQIGDVLTVYRRGSLVRDIYDDDMPVRLPSESAGNLMVFRTFDNISYAYVLDAELPIGPGDQIMPPQY